MIQYSCPKCKEPLKRINNSLVCVNKHCYDVSRKGYVNLLIHKSTLNPGDNDEMVLARKIVMQKGYYDKLIEAVTDIVASRSPSVLLDLGCGEGSLTARLADTVPTVIGMDISKFAINKAASQDKKTRYLVGSISAVPLENECVDIIVNCFAPLDSKEATRVLKSDGVLIKVTPAENHLFELKQEIYPEPYLNERKDEPKGFAIHEERIIKETVRLSGEYLDSVIKMTPYFYKTPKAYLESVKGKIIDSTLEFRISVLTKT